MKAWAKCMKSTWSLLAGYGGGSTENEARYCENVIFNSCPSEPAGSMWPRRHYQWSTTLESNWWIMEAIFENASSRRAIQHWNTMKHVMPSIPTISHLTQHPALVSISQSVHICPHKFKQHLTPSMPCCQGHKGHIGFPEWIWSLNVKCLGILNLFISVHIYTICIYVLYCTPISTSLSLHFTSAASV